MPALDNRDRRNPGRSRGRVRLDSRGLDTPGCNWDRNSGHNSGQAHPGHAHMLPPEDPSQAMPKTLCFAFEPPSNPIRASYQSATCSRARSLPMFAIGSLMFSCDWESVEVTVIWAASRLVVVSVWDWWLSAGFPLGRQFRRCNPAPRDSEMAPRVICGTQLRPSVARNGLFFVAATMG